MIGVGKSGFSTFHGRWLPNTSSLAVVFGSVGLFVGIVMVVGSFAGGHDFLLIRLCMYVEKAVEAGSEKLMSREDLEVYRHGSMFVSVHRSSRLLVKCGKSDMIIHSGEK